MEVFWEYVKAFVIGGLFCVIAQILIDKTKITPARVMVTFVVAGVIISALGWYQPLVDFAGAGATVPIIGFGHTMADGVRKAVDEKGILGIFTGAFTAGAGGITAAMVFGYLAAVIFKPKDK